MRYLTAKTLVIGALGHLLFVFGLVFFMQGSVSAARSVVYPDTSPNHYLSVSRSGGGIELNAPVSYLKAKFSADTWYYQFEVTDGCYAAIVDSGPGMDCGAFKTTFSFCPSDVNGNYDASYLGNGRCYNTDPSTWPFGPWTQLHSFKLAGLGGAAWPLDIPVVNGERFIYVVVQQHVTGLNGFKIQSVARDVFYNDSPSLSTSIGLAGQLDHPLSIVSLPLQPGGADTYSVRFEIPCTPVRNWFDIGWFDADRGGIPNDADIYWRLTNNTTGQSLTSGQFAFIYRADQLEAPYLGGNNETRGQRVEDVNFSGFALRVQQGDRYTFSWHNVDRNNGVQVMIPFSEVDVGRNCNQLNVTQGVSCTTPAGVTVRVNHSGTFDMRLIRNGSDTTLAVSGHPGNTNYHFAIPQAWASVASTYQVRVFQASPASERGRTITTSAINLGPCPLPPAEATCDISTNPSGPFEIGERFEVVVTVRNTSISGGQTISNATAPLYFRPASGLSGMPAPSANQDYGSVAPGGEGTAPVGDIYSDTPGLYNIRAALVLPTGEESCSGPTGLSVEIGTKPYLKTFGGDVLTGGAIGSGSCTPDPGRGGIHAWARNDGGGNYAGASAQLTVTSLLQVNEFYSASNYAGPVGSPSRPKGLTIANTGSGDPSTEYGGGSGVGRCITDYFNDTREGDTLVNWNGNNGSLPVGRDQYTLSGNIIGASGTVTIPASRQVAVYVTGDVYINSNIQYDTVGSWEIHPYLVIIASGDIRIAPNVTRLDGLYIAQRDSSSDGGTIYTCAPSVNGNYDLTNVFDACQNKLTVNGALISEDIRFLRMIGTLRLAPSGELPDSSNIAEVINYTPEMFLAPSPLRIPTSGSSGGPTNPNAVGPYNAIKSLPPIY